MDAPVAQWIEHRPPEPRVGGSNPLRREQKERAVSSVGRAADS